METGVRNRKITLAANRENSYIILSTGSKVAEMWKRSQLIGNVTLLRGWAIESFYVSIPSHISTDLFRLFINTIRYAVQNMSDLLGMETSHSINGGASMSVSKKVVTKWDGYYINMMGMLKDLLKLLITHNIFAYDR